MRITAWALEFAGWVVEILWQNFAEFILNFFVVVGVVLWWIFRRHGFLGCVFGRCLVAVLDLFGIILFLFVFILLHFFLRCLNFSFICLVYDGFCGVVGLVYSVVCV